MKTKLLTLFFAVLMSISAFAQTPTQADLASYVKSEHYVACFSTPENGTCNEIVWPGSYTGSSNWDVSDITKLVKCKELPNYPGWYVAVVPVIYDAGGNPHCGGKPVQLSECGTFDWEYQCGGPSTISLVAGSVDISANGSETDLMNWSMTEPTIIKMTAWKNSPCAKTCSEGQYTIRVIAPQCEEHPEFVPYISGSFNSWNTPIKMISNGSYYEYTTPIVSSNLQFKFINGPDKTDWTNQFVYYIPEDTENHTAAYWAEFDNFTLDPQNAMSRFYTRDGNVLTFDFSNQKKFRYNQCPVVEDELEQPISAEHVKIDDLYYNLNGENMTAEVTYEKSGSTENYTGLTNVVIPSTISYQSLTYSVTSIGEMAFMDCFSLKSAIIGDSVTSIGNSAFMECTDLTSVTIGDSVTNIDGAAFGWCTSLHSITIPNSVTSIGLSAFAGCQSMTAISVGEENTTYCSIDGVLFSKDKSVLVAFPGGRETYTIPNGVTRIGMDAFEAAILTDIKIPNSITTIGDYAFWGCSNLLNLEIPNSVTEIGEGAFNSVFNLIYSGTAEGAPWGAQHMNLIIDDIFIYEGVNKEKLISITAEASGDIIIPDNVRIIEEYAFADWSNKWNASITIPNSVTEIGENAFEGIYCIYYHGNAIGAPWGAQHMNLYKEGWITYENETKKEVLSCDEDAYGEITLPEGVEIIKEYAFAMCKKITQVKLPNSLREIRMEAFSGCKALTSIDIPEGVTTLGETIFHSCVSLQTISISKTVETFVQYEEGSFITPFLLTNVDVEYEEDFQEGALTTIIVDPENPYFASKDGILYNKNMTRLIQYPCAKRDAFTIPETVDSIGEYAFYFNQVLSEITIPNNIKTIGFAAFAFMHKLETIHLSEGLQKIEDDAFAETNIHSFIIPNSVEEIGEEACLSYGTQEIVIGSGVRKIGSHAFVIDTTQIKNITCNAIQVPEIEDNSFDFGHMKNDSFEEDVITKELTVLVSAQSVAAYKDDKIWGQYTIMSLSAEQTEIEGKDIVVAPSTTSVNIIWPAVENAYTYELVIRDSSGNVVCTLVFDSKGYVISLTFKNPERKNGSSDSQNVGFMFTINGLDESSTYTYTLTAKNDKDEVLNTESGSFTTASESEEKPNGDNHGNGNSGGSGGSGGSSKPDQGLDEVQSNKVQSTKILRDGVMFIERDGKTYTVTGQEVK